MKTIEICGTKLEVADNAKLTKYHYRQSIENLFNDVSCLPDVIRLENEVRIERLRDAYHARNICIDGKALATLK